MCISSWCPGKGASIKSKHTPLKTNLQKSPTYIKPLLLDVPYASKHGQHRGKMMCGTCFLGCQFWSTLPWRKSLFGRCCVTPSGKKSSAFLGLLFPSACRASATCPSPVWMSRAGPCMCPRLWRCCCWRSMLLQHQALTLLCTQG